MAALLEHLAALDAVLFISFQLGARPRRVCNFRVNQGILNTGPQHTASEDVRNKSAAFAMPVHKRNTSGSICLRKLMLHIKTICRI